MSGTGTVWSFVVPHPPLLPAYAELAPYNVVVVELDEDPTIRMVGNLVDGADAADQRRRPGTPSRSASPCGSCSSRCDDVVLPRWVRV